MRESHWQPKGTSPRANRRGGTRLAGSQSAWEELKDLPWRKRNTVAVPPGVVPTSLQGPAQLQFEQEMANFADLVYDEAQRLEAAQNSVRGSQEITATIVQTAARRIREPLGATRRRFSDLILFLIGSIAALLIGLLGSQISESFWAAVACIVLAPIVIGCALISYMRER